MARANTTDRSHDRPCDVEEPMSWAPHSNPRMATLGLGLLLILGDGAGVAQTPGATRAPEPAQGREGLTRQIQDLRTADKLDEAAALAERVLELERRAGGQSTAGVAEGLSRL